MDTLPMILACLSPTIAITGLMHTYLRAHDAMHHTEMATLQHMMSDNTHKLQICEEERQQYYRENIALMQRLVRGNGETVKEK